MSPHSTALSYTKTINPLTPSTGLSAAFGLLLYAMMAAAALVPSVQTPEINAAELLINAKEITLLFVSLLALFLHIRTRASCDVPRIASHTVTAVALYLWYSLTSVAWTDADHACVMAQCVISVLVVCSIYLPYAYVRMNTVANLKRAVAWSMLLFTAICCIYTAESLFSLGLRSAVAANLDPLVGIVRVKGPLFAASLGYLLIIPGIAYFSDTSICSFRAVIRYCCVFCLVVTLLASASRGGLICLSLFCILSLRYSMALKGHILNLLMLFVLVGLGAWYASTYISANRFLTLDDGRPSLYENAIDVIVNRPLTLAAAGTGIASIWPYAYFDQQIRRNIPAPSITTRAGQLSTAAYNYHPHSVPLYLIGEYGLFGLLLFGAYAAFVLKLYRAAASARHAVIFCCGLCIALPACFLDLFFLYTHNLGILWWFWAFSALIFTAQPQYIHSPKHLRP